MKQHHGNIGQGHNMFVFLENRRWYLQKQLLLDVHTVKSGLAIVAMRRWSQWPFHFSIQNVKKEAFWICPCAHKLKTLKLLCFPSKYFAIKACKIIKNNFTEFTISLFIVMECIFLTFLKKKWLGHLGNNKHITK
jgi:hypothetical protein